MHYTERFQLLHTGVPCVSGPFHHESHNLRVGGFSASSAIVFFLLLNKTNRGSYSSESHRPNHYPGNSPSR